MKTYIDESGNTGDDLLETKQPYFIMSAVSVSDDKENAVKQVVKNEFNANKEKEEIEIKAKSWVKSSKKRNALQNILNSILENQSDISIVILEKKYMISALVVEYFFDGAYNDNEEYSWVNDNTLKVETANYYYDKLDDNEICILGNIFRNPTPQELHRVLDIVKSKTDNEKYLQMILGAKNHIEEQCKSNNELNQKYNKEYARGVFRSPNFTTFHAMGNMIARNCKIKNYSTNIVFDDASLCNDAFNHLYSIFSKAEKDLILKNGTGLYTWKNRILGFSIDKAENNPMLQIADIIASSVLQTILKMDSNSPKYYKYDAFILALLFMLLDFNNVYITASNKFQKRLFDTINDVSNIIDTLH